ncbi:MAG: CRTAC1 family protein [Paracoccaceae bacterium]|nr:CRTAC1 family protein [Paracoccaceae bacterium]
MKLVAILFALPAVALADPAFVDRAPGLPVAQVYDGGWEYFVGGGVAILDCNADGRPDLFAAGGANPARLFVNTTAPGGDIAFEIGTAAPLTGVTGAWPLDVDGDGWLDLAVLRVGPNVLLKGGPGCHFSDATAEWSFAGGDRWSTAFAATWQPGQGWPTLAIGNYVDRNRPDGPFEACDVNELHRPKGRGFTAPKLLEPGFCALSMLISDWKRNGSPDLRISNDRHYYVRGGYEQMFHLTPFAPYTEAEGWRKVSLWGMGIASRDITGDGFPEVMLTSMADQLLQFNDAGVMRDAPYSLGTYATTPHLGDDGRPSTGWHAEFGDIDNDGRSDLFIAKGNVDEMPSNAMKDPNNLLMQTEDGTFAEMAATAGVATTERSRGAGLVDLNADGRLDIVVMNRRAPMEIWQNVTESTGNWLEIEPRMPGSNTRAVGAWIEMRTEGGAVQSQEVTVGGGHGSGHAGPLHFGLGRAEKAEVRVIWPEGDVSQWTPLQANQKVLVWPDGPALSVE